MAHHAQNGATNRLLSRAQSMKIGRTAGCSVNDVKTENDEQEYDIAQVKDWGLMINGVVTMEIKTTHSNNYQNTDLVELGYSGCNAMNILETYMTHTKDTTNNENDDAALKYFQSSKFDSANVSLLFEYGIFVSVKCFYAFI